MDECRAEADIIPTADMYKPPFTLIFTIEKCTKLLLGVKKMMHVGQISSEKLCYRIVCINLVNRSKKRKEVG